VRYCNNHSMHYDSKEFLEYVSKLFRENATGSLEISESVTIKLELRIRNAVFATGGQLN